MDDADRVGIPLIEELSDSDTGGNERKRAAHSQPEAKRAKRRKLTKPKDVDDEALDTELGVNHKIAHMDSKLIADYVMQRTQRFQPNLSLVELDDMRFPEKAIVDSTMWNKSRTGDNLADFLEIFSGLKRKKKKGMKLSVAPDKKGHPHTIVVAGAGLRAANLARALRRFQSKDGMVAKLFAKHIKFEEAKKMVTGNRICIGVGTPQRLIDLTEDGALSLTDLERIVIDASHIDQKKRGILDMKETQLPLMQLLSRQELKDRYVSEEMKIDMLFF